MAAIDLKGGAWVNEQTAEGNFAGWAFTGGVVQSLAAAQAPDGGVALVAIGLDNAVWVDEQCFTASEADFGTIDGSWSGFSSLGGNAAWITALNSGFGTLDVITQDSSGNEWVNIQKAGGKWSGFVAYANPRRRPDRPPPASDAVKFPEEPQARATPTALRGPRLFLLHRLPGHATMRCRDLDTHEKPTPRHARSKNYRPGSEIRPAATVSIEDWLCPRSAGGG